MGNFTTLDLNPPGFEADLKKQEERKVGANPVSSKHPSTKPTPGPASLKPRERIDRFPAAVDIGQGIVGSVHQYPLVTAKVRSPLPATATVSVSPAETRVSRTSVAEEVGDVANDRRRMAAFADNGGETAVKNGVAIRVQFAPTFAGEHAADITVLVRWRDGEHDRQTVRVNAHARTLEDVPSKSIDEYEPGRTQNVGKGPIADLQNVPMIYQTRLEHAFKVAHENARHLAANQKLGAEGAGKQAGGYQRKPNDSAWDVLLEIALMAGVASVAGLVAKTTTMFLAPRLHSLKPFAAVKEKTLEKLADGLIGDGIKETIKGGAKAADVQKALRSKPENAPVGLDEFFGRQMEALEQLQHYNALAVINKNAALQHGLRTQPEEAIAIMQSLGEAFEHAALHAIEIQRLQSTLAWVAYVGRAENGGKDVRVNGEQRPTTDLSNATGSTRGVLRLRAVDGRLRSASIDGVTQRSAGELVNVKLSTAAIPIVILVGDPLSHYITRDEVGRVRMPYFEKAREVNQHRDAQKLVDSLLGRTLLESGVATIATDDVGGKS